MSSGVLDKALHRINHEDRSERNVFIEFSHVSFTYPKSSDSVLKDVSFKVYAGEKLSMMGLSGSGKSTVLGLICGLLQPSGGQVKVFGHDLARLERWQIRNICKDLGVALQKGGLFASMNVSENLRFAMERMRGWDDDEQASRIERFLRGVSLTHARTKYPDELSGGMRCRVVLARALCTDPRLALLDSPTAGLDPISSRQILSMVTRLAEDGSAGAVMLFTAYVEVGLIFSRRVLLLHQGTVVADGPWASMVEGSQNDSWSQHFLTHKFKTYPSEYLRALGFSEKFIQGRS